MISLQKYALMFHRSWYQPYTPKGPILNKKLADPNQTINDLRRAESTTHSVRKTLADNRSLQFHQCYFNPISCFRR